MTQAVGPLYMHAGTGLAKTSAGTERSALQSNRRSSSCRHMLHRTLYSSQGSTSSPRAGGEIASHPSAMVLTCRRPGGATCFMPPHAEAYGEQHQRRSVICRWHDELHALRYSTTIPAVVSGLNSLSTAPRSSTDVLSESDASMPQVLRQRPSRMATDVRW